ncbi:MAG: amino acid--tRNA ligase-related protein, partial [Henriciella sp.]|uniref:amino acid--tRNA ligase-related protein n=1 Tax=Henriciella sp. TaxID=1968823 RepID=UPI003C731490
FETMEPVFRGIFEEFGEGKPVTQEFRRIPYDEAMRKYGSDKPDLRIPIEMEAVTAHFAGSGFKVFAGMIERDPKVEVWAIPAKTGGSRAFCDRMNSWAQGEGQPGLGYIFWREEEGAVAGAGPIAKNIGPERTEAIRTQLGLEAGDACFFAAGDPKAFATFAGAARARVGEELDLIDRDRFELAWIVDFPFYEWDEDEKRIDFSHNPFSMPQGGLEAFNSEDPLDLKAWQYDLVCNGYEIVSGGIRNHVPELMVKAFEKVGMSKEDVETEFGGLYRAFQYGAPPHGGMAAGIDRIVMILCGAKNLRDIALFPMNQQAVDLLMGAPAPAEDAQLKELNLRLAPQVKKDT